jgi:hypothetical protein
MLNVLSIYELRLHALFSIQCHILEGESVSGTVTPSLNR